ncbi:MAG TPA: response regulator [Thermoanaerobaculia bacterium]|nr:response regulator [Thermoanaerobaculia bacterium]
MPKRILLADDSLTIQKVVELTFSDSDFELVCVSNGQRALEKVREEQPDLILADVVMPEKNGYEVCEAIKGNPATARIPVVLLSGTFEPFDRDRAERIGADAIVSKPFDSQQLLAQVEALLSRAPREQRAATAPAGETTVVVPMSGFKSPPPASADASTGKVQQVRPGTEPVLKQNDAPFEAGFQAEDFTGTVRLPPAAELADPFEEEYGRAGVDSVIEAFEKVPPGFGFSGDAEIEIDDARLSGKQLADEPGGASPEWLALEPERAAAPPRKDASPDAFDVWTANPSGKQVVPPSEATVALRGPLSAPTLAESIAAAKTVPQETSIPEVTEMFSTVARTNGGLSEADIERVAAKVVEKLSDKIVREIAWEIIPDMAEIVIKQRIKELESGIE